MEAPAPPSTPCWSTIVKQNHPPPNQNHHHEPQSASTAAAAAAGRVLVESCKSTKGIAVAVVDANAIIQGGERLHNCADKFVSVSQVIDEIRDPKSRHSLNFLPFSVDTLEPSPESLKKVISFAKATGDLQTLSDVDLKLIALTYTLEAQIHGTNHLRDVPPPIHTVNVKRLPEKDLPGWGSNVPNLEEWEALEQAVGDGSNPESRILPLKDLNLNIIASDKDQNIDDGSSANGSEAHYENSLNQEDADGSLTKSRNFLPKKKEVNIEGKIVADGIDASQGQYNDDAGNWLPAVSRSTHRRFLKRQAKREMNEAAIEKDYQPEENRCDEDLEDSKCPDLVMDEHLNEAHESKVTKCENGAEEISTILNQMGLEEESKNSEVPAGSTAEADVTFNDSENLSRELDEIEVNDQQLENVEITSQTNESVDASYMDDSSEQSWMLRSLSESSVACITSDFAMQNVILQMGLRLLAPGGMQIRELHRWILKCHACYKVTSDIGRIFCPNCGNGGTLRKVAITVGENGIVLKARRPRISVRGTKFSLPLPQGGRDAITKNPILREDQLPQKYLHPKTKKKNKEGDDEDLLFAASDLFLHHTDKKAPLQPPVRKALAVFSGKRNPNDNYYSRVRH